MDKQYQDKTTIRIRSEPPPPHPDLSHNVHVDWSVKEWKWTSTFPDLQAPNFTESLSPTFTFLCSFTSLIIPTIPYSLLYFKKYIINRLLLSESMVCLIFMALYCTHCHSKKLMIILIHKWYGQKKTSSGQHWTISFEYEEVEKLNGRQVARSSKESDLS